MPSSSAAENSLHATDPVHATDLRTTDPVEPLGAHDDARRNSRPPHEDGPERENHRLRETLRPAGPAQLEISQRELNGVVVVSVGGEVDVLTAPRLGSKLHDLVHRRRENVVIDLTHTRFIDSMGLHTLLNAQRRLTRRGRRLGVICGNGPVRRVIELARLTETLGVVCSLDEYLAGKT